MSTVFNKEYSSTYDLLYKDKDYPAECDLIEKIITEHSQSVPKSILDLGCGTGNHSILLAERGYEVTGVDISEEMLAIAKSKAKGKEIDCTFLHGDIRTFVGERKYDAIIMMFAVFGYQITNEDIFNALQTVRRHLNPGGVFFCDIWYGPAVLKNKPGERIRVLLDGERQIIRTSSGELDSFSHTVDVRFHLWTIDHQCLIAETEEIHKMRFFFPQELTFFFEMAGLSLELVRAYPDWDRSPDEDTWSVGIVGSKK
jgi:SAM-dependent methyltransferase